MHADAENRVRWTGAPGHYEVWYLTFNDRPTGTGCWLRYTLEAPQAGPPYAQLWFALFDRRQPERSVAFSRRLPIESFHARPAPFEAELGTSRLTSHAARGQIEGGGHAASWDLTFAPGRTLRPLPGLVYRVPFAETIMTVPAPDAAFSGRLEADGRRIDLDRQPGCQTHLWGTKHAHAWAWGHCSAFDGGEAAVLECTSVRLARHGLVLPAMTLVTLRLGGEELALRSLAHGMIGRSAWDTGRYEFRALCPEAIVEGAFTARPEHVTEARYEDPDGASAWCRNTEIGDLEVVLRRRAGVRWREAARLRASGTAHFETASRSPVGGIVRQHEEIV